MLLLDQKESTFGHFSDLLLDLRYSEYWTLNHHQIMTSDLRILTSNQTSDILKRDLLLGWILTSNQTSNLRIQDSIFRPSGWWCRCCFQTLDWHRRWWFLCPRRWWFLRSLHTKGGGVGDGFCTPWWNLRWCRWCVSKVWGGGNLRSEWWSGILLLLVLFTSLQASLWLMQHSHCLWW